ncbi:MAG: hypothetical protein J1E36_01585 [Eubacterium sp.]|nr:hypothetical protein [Eubacterium sp.]
MPKNINKKKNNKFSIRKLIYNDKYLIIISIVLALVIWVVTSINLSPQTTKTITVPVTVDLSGSVAEQLGLKSFGDDVIDVDVTISCKKYRAMDITADSLNVYLQTNVVTSNGNFDVPIRVEARENSDYTITSYYPTAYRAYFDVEDEKVMDIDINYINDNFIEDGYTMGQTLLSESTVTLKGPRSYVSQVTSVCADVNITEKLKETTSMDLILVALNSYGSEVDYITFDQGTENLTITIPVLKEMQLDVATGFIGKPSKVNTDNFNVSYSVNRVNAGVLEEANITQALIGNIDFSMLMPGENKFTFNTQSLDGVVILDDIDEIEVTITVPKDYKTKTISVNSSGVKIINAPEGYKVSVSDISSGKVTVVGTQSDLARLSNSNVNLVVDLSGVDADNIQEGISTYDITTTLEISESCWIYGNYTAKVNITKA